MKLLSSLSLTVLSLSFSTLFAEETDQREKSFPAYMVTEIRVDSSLKNTEALFVFTFSDSKGIVKKPVKFSFNGQDRMTTPDTQGHIALNVKPGKYKFQFYLDSMHLEVYTDWIAI